MKLGSLLYGATWVSMVGYLVLADYRLFISSVFFGFAALIHTLWGMYQDAKAHVDSHT